MKRKRARSPPSGMLSPHNFLGGYEICRINDDFRYRYRKWDLGNEVVLVARCEHDAVMAGANNEMMFLNIKALNEWDSKVSGVRFFLAALY